MRTTARTAAALAALILAPAIAEAGEIVIALPQGMSAQTTRVAYDCGGFGRVEAAYINAPPVALATLALKGEFVVLANVLSGSGARYAGGRYIWWNKGRTSDLYDLTLGEESPPVASCIASP